MFFPLPNFVCLCCCCSFKVALLPFLPPGNRLQCLAPSKGPDLCEWALWTADLMVRKLCLFKPTFKPCHSCIIWYCCNAQLNYQLWWHDKISRLQASLVKKKKRIFLRNAFLLIVSRVYLWGLNWNKPCLLQSVMLWDAILSHVLKP